MDIGSNIRFYRMGMGLTQEALAELLSVSHQTVSKWERQLLYPDITMLPKLATVFRVSIDNLLNFNVSEMRKYQVEVKEKLCRLNQNGDLAAQKSLLEEALQKYPNEPYFAERLLNVCVPLAMQGKLSEEKFLRLRRIGDEVLRTDADRWLSDSILRALALICVRMENHKSEAVFYYKRLPDMRHIASNIAHLIGDEAEYQEQTEAAIIDHVYYAALHCRNLARHATHMNEKREKLLASSRMIETLFCDDNYGYFSTILVKNYYDLSMWALHEDTEMFFEFAEKCLTIAARYACFLRGDYHFIFGKIPYDKGNYYDKTDYLSQYTEKYLSDVRVLSLRAHTRFSAVFNDLPKTSIDRKNEE